MEMNFCRRCSAKLTQTQEYAFQCASGHLIFANSPAATGMMFINDKKQVLVIRRAIDPGKGKIDMGGGFCDGGETAEACLLREVQEELGLSPADYDPPKFLLSCIDSYEFKGEVVPVLSLIFWTHIKPNAHITVADDVAAAEFASFEAIDSRDIQFESFAKSLEVLRDRGVI
ncbi:MAG TPA: NUDIX domain-containing protein [Candidatus Saccharimonadales bacterium]|nr:NUDIX domain-containing protein [Candidatus Saccharimonadales bacterium]